MRFSACLCLAMLALLASLFAAPATLGEQMEIDNPKVIAYLSTLQDTHIRTKVSGVRLSDGSALLKGAELLGIRHLPAKRQHLYLFRDSDGVSAFVWIEKGGRSLPIPVDTAGPPGEDAHILSGDVYTSAVVEPDAGLVILTGASLEWFEKLK